ncbi:MULTISPECIES: (2Fe-2S) ferredoxin domain-containing protein [unclassified Flavobacterium]|uniref:(2Fe-2S) ferredoxin domain-containing protein n=1 Tax=unclassified Flavobacterium TaxID=196869 RepID=UPI00262B97C5|nr:(2Fe-2S) ferredoxin domain-containing protein [Flavobacterium sp.]
MKKLDAPQKAIYFCDGSKCSKENKHNRKAIRTLVKEAGLKNEVALVKTFCTDNCKCAPVIAVQPENLWFGDVSEKKAVQIFEEYIAPPILTIAK